MLNYRNQVEVGPCALWNVSHRAFQGTFANRARKSSRQVLVMSTASIA
jgi:hypothetical protein